ncbi:MAG: hypothetical protein ACOVN7_04220, partial [Rubrivivax sp.]
MFSRILSVFALTVGLSGGAASQRLPVDASQAQAVPVAPGVWMVQGLSALGSSANRNFISNAGFVVT